MAVGFGRKDLDLRFSARTEVLCLRRRILPPVLKWQWFQANGSAASQMVASTNPDRYVSPVRRRNSCALRIHTVRPRPPRPRQYRRTPPLAPQAGFFRTIPVTRRWGRPDAPGDEYDDQAFKSKLKSPAFSGVSGVLAASNFRAARWSPGRFSESIAMKRPLRK